jgi:hypothetical protein
MGLTTEQWGGQVRAILSAVGGALGVLGYLDTAVLEAAMGGASVLVASVWSIYVHWPRKGSTPATPVV